MSKPLISFTGKSYVALLKTNKWGLLEIRDNGMVECEWKSACNFTRMDPTQVNPALPAGHPFSNVKREYWSSTAYEAFSNSAWTVPMADGNVFSSVWKDLFALSASRKQWGRKQCRKQWGRENNGVAS